MLLPDDCILKEYGSSRGCRASPRSPNFAFSTLNSHYPGRHRIQNFDSREYFCVWQRRRPLRPVDVCQGQGGELDGRQFHLDLACQHDRSHRVVARAAAAVWVQMLLKKCRRRNCLLLTMAASRMKLNILTGIRLGVRRAQMLRNACRWDPFWRQAAWYECWEPLLTTFHNRGKLLWLGCWEPLVLATMILPL